MPNWLEAFVILFILLILARIIKRGSKFLQRYFIPSALVGGFIALMIGPQLFKWAPNYIYEQWSIYPKILINLVFAGLFLGSKIPGTKEIWKKSAPMLAFGNTLAWGQYVIGIGLTLLVLGPVFNAHPLTGALIEISFEGGHGTAAGLAPTFANLGWAEGTDIALGLATVSIFTAIFSGILIINIRNRINRKIFSELGMKQQQQRMIRSGYSLTKFANKLETSPKEIIVTIVLFALSIGIGWIIQQALVFFESIALNNVTDIRFFKYLPLFPLAMLGGLIMQLSLHLINKSHIVKKNTIKVVSGLALDLLLISSIATLSLSTIRDNFAVFIILAIAGVAWILGAFFYLSPRFFKKHWFENGMTNIGQSMGMTATGLLMNRLVDPANTTHARESFAYKQLAFEPFMGGGLITSSAVIAISEFGQIPTLVFAVAIFLFWAILGFRLGQNPKITTKILRHKVNLGKLAIRK